MSVGLCGAFFFGACAGDEPEPTPSGGMGGTGAVGGTSGMGGAGGTAGMGGMGGASGMGGTGGTGGMPIMEPPIMGPAPTACVPMADAAPAAKTVLYTGSELLEGLSLRRADLFATDATGIVRLSEGATTLARVTSATVDEVLPADLRIYWVDAGSLYRVDYDADAAVPELVASGLQVPATLLRHDETNVFYAHAGSSSVWRQPLDGSAGVQLVTGASVKDLFVQGGSVFFASGQKIQSVLAMDGGGQRTDVVTDAPRAVTDIETDGVDMVWTDGVEVFATGVEDAAVRTPLTQAGPSASGVGQSRIKLLALHGTAVYFADNAGNIGSALVNGSACRLIIEGAGDVRGLVVDDDFIYANVRVQESSELWRIEL